MGRPMDPTLQTAVLAGLEAAMQRALHLAPQTREQLAPLQSNVYALHCTSPTLSVFLHVDEPGLRLAGTHEGKATTTITGTASDFRELAMSNDPAATLINGGLALEGDSAPLIELQKALSQMDVDWESPLVETLGDVAGHQLAELLRHAFSWGKKTSQSLERQLSEFIHEEARLCPPRLELEDFFGDVGELVQRVERLQAHSDRLRKRIEGLQD